MSSGSKIRDNRREFVGVGGEHLIDHGDVRGVDRHHARIAEGTVLLGEPAQSREIVDVRPQAADGVFGAGVRYLAQRRARV